MKSRSLLLLLCALCCNSLWAATPADVVNSFHEALLSNMHAGTKTACDDRVAKLGVAIDKDFDLPYLAQLALHRRWSGLSETQRTQFIAAFRELVVLTYVSNFSGYDGEKFTTVDTQDMNGGFKTVHALLKPTSGDAVHFDYVLHGNDADGWRIVNIIADGVSDLAVRSSQYEQKFQEAGFDGLIKALRDQIVKAKQKC